MNAAAARAPGAAIPAIGTLRVALIGYGEVGGIFGRALRPQVDGRIRTYDRLFGGPEGQPVRQRSVADGVEAAPTPRHAVAGAQLVICAVTADQTEAAASSVAEHLVRGAIYLDVNSASPATKSRCAERIGAGGGRYVEMAVMASVPPYGIAVPMLSGGPHAQLVQPLLASLGFDVEQASDRYGVASAIKLCRSVVVKGMEAMVIESFMAARRYGVEREVLASLAETFPGLDWEKAGDYFFQRVIQHGRRRAEEMRAAAATVGDVGVDGWVASAAAERNAWMAALAADGTFADLAKSADWRTFADRIAGHAAVKRPGEPPST